jgi:hypothetical protein
MRVTGNISARLAGLFQYLVYFLLRPRNKAQAVPVKARLFSRSATANVMKLKVGFAILIYQVRARSRIGALILVFIIV